MSAFSIRKRLAFIPGSKREGANTSAYGFSRPVISLLMMSAATMLPVIPHLLKPVATNARAASWPSNCLYRPM